jgi:glycosyltransferase involved in cell wall biosynthesis
MYTTPKKIALLGYKLSNGGAERVLSETSFVLENAGYEVHVIIMIDEVTYHHAGKLFNVGALRNDSNTFFNKWNRFNALRKYIKKEKFNAFIDFRFRVNTLQELFLYSLYKGIKIQTVRSGKYENYLFKNKVLSKFVFSKFDAIVCIAEKQLQAIKQERHFTNLTIIQNPISINKIEHLKQESIDVDFPFILTAGRLFPEKQIDQLVLAYAQTTLPQQGIKLLIIGQGHEKTKIETAILESGMINYVHLLGFQHNPYPYYKQAKYVVQSSLYEGLPNVLIESLATGTPVVAFDCFSGPSEIIVHQVNGWLVKDQDFAELTLAMEEMNRNIELYSKCKNNTISSVEKFSPQIIGNKWVDLLENLFAKSTK